MINSKIREYLKDEGVECAILDSPSFDNSIIGLTTDGKLVYDFELMVQEYVKDTAEEYTDAIDFISYNTLRALPYMGNNAPVVINKLEGVL